MTEEWMVHAKLIGEFHISDEHRFSEVPLAKGFRRLELTPEFDKDGKWTGFHDFKALLSIENRDGAVLESHVVHEQAKRLVDTVTALIMLETGRPVRMPEGISVKRHLIDEPPTYRLIVNAVQTASFAPPTQFVAELLSVSIDPKIMRVIRWWARGLAASDAVDRLVALNNALDLLVGLIDDMPGRVRKCKSCGFEEAIGPGLRERVIHFLTDMLGYEHSVASDIYESRLDLAHARSSLEEDDLRKYRKHATLTATAVRTGIARALAISLPPSPEALPFDVSSALLDIKYVDTEAAQESHNEP